MNPWAILGLASGASRQSDRRDELDSYLAHNEAGEEQFSREMARLFPKGAAIKERLERSASPKPSR